MTCQDLYIDYLLDSHGLRADIRGYFKKNNVGKNVREKNLIIQQAVDAGKICAKKYVGVN